MKKYYMSIVDFSEIANVTADQVQLDIAAQRLVELGLLTEKGNPSSAQISKAIEDITPQFCTKLERRLARRRGGIGGVYATMRKLQSQGDYSAVYLYLAIMYGYLDWQVPEKLAVLPGNHTALQRFVDGFLSAFEDYIKSTNVEQRPNEATSV